MYVTIKNHVKLSLQTIQFIKYNIYKYIRYCRNLKKMFDNIFQIMKTCHADLDKHPETLFNNVKMCYHKKLNCNIITTYSSK